MITTISLPPRADADSAMQELVERYGPGLTRFVASRISPAHLIDEVVQSTFIVAWQGMANYRAEGSLDCWLKGIAKNLIHGELRKRHRQLRGLCTVDEHAFTALEVDQGSAGAPTNDDPEAASCDSTVLATCLGRLRSRDRLMIERRYLHDLPLKRIAQQFKEPLGRITMRIHRIRVTLRREIIKVMAGC